MPAPPKVVTFDVIGTTFSLEPMRAELTRLGFPRQVLEIWFARALRDAFALAATDTFAPFRAIFDSNLDELALSYSIAIEPEQKERVLSRFGTLPAHPDAMEAFQLLRDAGIRLIALSNGAAPTSKKLLEGAGLMPFIECVVSVEDVGLFKPRREVYIHTVRLAGITPAEMALVATHAWDLHGGKCAGLMTGFVSRGQIFPLTMKQPDVAGDSLTDVARGFLV